jgi:hypothetical protein
MYKVSPSEYKRRRRILMMKIYIYIYIYQYTIVNNNPTNQKRQCFHFFFWSLSLLIDKITPLLPLLVVLLLGVLVLLLMVLLLTVALLWHRVYACVVHIIQKVKLDLTFSFLTALLWCSVVCIFIYTQQW